MTKTLAVPLVVGDILTLLAFSLGGLTFHQTEGLWLLEFVRISWPFFVGYGVCAALLGAWRGDRSAKQTYRAGALAWLVGTGLGILMRMVATGRIPIASFILVTYAFTGVLMLGWRWFFCRFRSQ